MAALLYASRLPGCPYEIGLVASNDPEAEALTLAEAEGVATFALSHKGMKRAEHDAAMEQAANPGALKQEFDSLDSSWTAPDKTGFEPTLHAA